MTPLNRRSLMALAMAPAIVPSRARSQTTLPDKGMHILVGFSTGGFGFAVRLLPEHHFAICRPEASFNATPAGKAG